MTRQARPAGLLALLLAAASLPAGATAYKGLDGSALLRMCKGADKVRALSVMCHNYLNGYLDAAHHYSPKPGFCLGEGEKKTLPPALVGWIEAHPDQQKQPAGEVLDRALKALHPCKGRP